MKAKIKGWMIKCYTGEIFYESLAYSRVNCIKRWSATNWKVYYRAGYRCVPVTITED